MDKEEIKDMQFDQFKNQKNHASRISVIEDEPEHIDIVMTYSNPKHKSELIIIERDKLNLLIDVLVKISGTEFQKTFERRRLIEALEVIQDQIKNIKLIV